MIGYAAIADSELDVEQLSSLLADAALASMLHSQRPASPTERRGEPR
jgi:hypothetical protein